MFTEGEIEEYARERQINQTQAERDMYLTCLLLLLSKNRIAQYLVFKGGTCLAKIHFKEWRISQDIDFTLRQKSKDRDIFNQLIQLFSGDTGQRQMGEIPFQIQKAEKKKDGKSCELTLEYERHKDIPQVIRFQISLRDDIIYDEFSSKLIERKYFEKISSVMSVKHSFPKFMCLHKYEIIAEKLRAAVQRLGERDLFDTWFFLQTEKALSPKIKKLLRKMLIMKLWKEKISFDWQEFKDGLDTVSQSWLTCKECIPQYMWNGIPSIDEVKREFLFGYEFLRNLTNEEIVLTKEAFIQRKKELYNLMQRKIVQQLKRL